MHNLRIFFMGSSACGLDSKPEVPRCTSLTEIGFRPEQIRFKREAQERGIEIAAYVQELKTDVSVTIRATDIVKLILSICS